MRPRRLMMSPLAAARHLLASIAALFALSSFAGCQLIFDEYSVEPASPPLPRVCESRAYRCTGVVLERCSDDRSRWDQVQECATESDCNLNSQACRQCRPGEFMCVQNQLLKCDSSFTFQLERTCATAALCSVSAAADHLLGQCDEPLCTPGSATCHNAELLRCTEGGNAWESVAVCATAAVCQQTVANDPAPVRCEPAACLPNEYSCEGSTLRHCNADRTGWESIECGSAYKCSAGLGACQACVPNQTECTHGELRKCSGNGEWQTVQVCAAPALCNAAQNTCSPGACPSRGMTRCRPDLPNAILEECGADLEWRTVAVCASPTLCDATNRRCEPAGCSPSDRRCSGDALQVCSSDSTRFQTVTVCPAGTCDAATARCGSRCQSGSLRCNDVHLEECVEGAWLRRKACATPQLCDATSPTPGCLDPKCGGSLGDRRCEGPNLLVCSRARTDWTLDKFCIGDVFCDAGLPVPGQAPDSDFRTGFGVGHCHQCIPGRSTCVGTELHLCQGNGTDEVKIADCAAGCVTDGLGARCGP